LELYKSVEFGDIKLDFPFVDFFNFRPIGDVKDCLFEGNWALDAGEIVVMFKED
jgi:hypothetical protein